MGRKPKSRRRLARALAAFFAVSLVIPAYASASAVTDTFTRDTSTLASWGFVSTTTVGSVKHAYGGWYTYANDTVPTSSFIQYTSLSGTRGTCSDPCGYIEAPSPNTSRQAMLPETLNGSTTLRDATLTVDFQLAKLPANGSMKFQAVARTGGTNGIDGYQATVTVSPAGATTYGVTKSYGTGPTTANIGTWTAGTTLAVKTWWTLQFQIHSTSTTSTTLKVRAWKRGTTTPSYTTWTDTQAALQTSGYPALRVFTGSGVSNIVAPFGMLFDNFEVDNFDTPPTAPADPGVSGGSSAWTSGSRTITASAATAGSVGPIDHYEHRVLTDSTISATANGQSVVISTPGMSWAQFRAVDVYGNASSWYPSVFSSAAEALIDATGPTTPTVVGGFQQAVSGPVAVQASSSMDTGSGLLLDANGAPVYEYRLSTDNGVSWSTPATAVSGQEPVSATGTTLVQFRAQDNAGNFSAWGGPASYTAGGDATNHITISPGAGNGTDACATFTDPIRGQGYIRTSDEVGGVVHLTAAGSPWVVNCQTLHVDATVPLIVDPGAVMEFYMGTVDGFGHRNGSSLEINGSITAGSSIGPSTVFESINGAAGTTTFPLAGDWAGITVNDPGNTSSFTNVAVMFAGGQTGTTPAISTGTGDVTIDKSSITKNYEDISNTTKPGAVQISYVSAVHSLTITHSAIEDNHATGVKSINGTLLLDHNDMIDRNYAYGVWFNASTGATSYNMGSVNHSSISDNYYNGIHATVTNSPSGLTYPSGANNNITHNGDNASCNAGNGCTPGEILADGFIPQNPFAYDQFDFRNNYLGPIPIEYMCPVTVVPGDTPNDPLYGLPYQMRDGVNLAIDLAVEVIKERALGNPITDPAVEWLAHEIETALQNGVTTLGFKEWYALPVGSAQEVASVGGQICYYDEVPTAPALLTAVDNSNS